MSEVSLVITEGSDGKSYELFVRQPEMIDAILGMFDQRKIKYTINRVEDDGQ